MDNLAHALAGAALGHAGLKKFTVLAVATLVIAANVQDIDVVRTSNAVRAGLT
jgi:inner membrane protein